MYRLTLAAALIGLPAFAAVAQSVPPTVAPGPTVAAASPMVGNDKLSAIHAARVTMVEAVETAERTGGQGLAIDVEFERADGSTPAHYEIKVLYTDGTLVEHDVDANTGAILKSESRRAGSSSTALKLADLKAAGTSLREAIAIAEQRAGNGARVVEAEIERSGGAISYELELRTAGGKRDMKVDANGQARG